MKYSSLEKRLDKLMPLKKEEPMEYVAYWGDDAEAQDTTDFIAVWGGKG